MSDVKSKEEDLGMHVQLAALRFYPESDSIGMAFEREPIKVLSHQQKLDVLDGTIEILKEVYNRLKDEPEMFA